MEGAGREGMEESGLGARSPGAREASSVLAGLGAEAGPAVVLGTDTLRKRERMWYTPDAVYV